ncbi:MULTISPECIES: hypothetical protein [Nocardioides]|uniref:LLM class flavin-dependent oxidoreductase n=1 Tax=Nocardioides vastitatis TaxID=2568655 RepID=A0ABW0ZFD9_9ACTN|nr:hypothetical protein [Nocardioides sp.]THJ02336.1 hypothetical protein E7Z54_10365 [Nocardioides sp.]
MVLSSALHRARGSMRVQQQLTRVRVARDRLIDHPLRQLERARRRLVSEDVDVLLLGDSSMLCWSPRDTDRTMIPTMLADRIGGNVVTVQGPGYGAAIYGEALRILGTLDRRPSAVVFSMAVRLNTATHVLRHPVVGYPRSLRALATVKGAGRPIRYVGRGGSSHTDAERSAFYALPVTSRWSGDHTIDYFRRRLDGMGAPPWPEELERLRFDYFHGERVLPDNPGLPLIQQFGRQVEDYGVPTVGFWSKPPLQRGELHFPGEFESHVRDNLSKVQAALSAGGPSLPPLLEIDIAEDEFEDSQNAIEHFDHAGRTKIAEALASVVSRTG